MQLLLRGFFFRIIVTVLGFLMSLLIAKLAGTNQFGSLSLIIVNAALIHIITGLGTDAAIVWHGIAGKDYDRNKIFSFTITTASIQFVFFCLLAIIAYIFLGHTLLGGSYDLNIFFAEIVYFAGLVLADKFLSLYYSQQEVKLCNQILAISSTILFIPVVWFWMIKPAIISEYPIWIYSLYIFIPAFILAVFFIAKYNPAIKNISQEEFKSFSTFSVIVLITNLIQFIAYRADYWIISIYYDHDMVGIYAQASKFAQLLWIIPGILTGLITPALKNERQRFFEKDLISTCRLSFYLHMILLLCLIPASFLIYQFFLPEEYFNGFYSLLIMLPGYLFFGVTIIMASYFSANRLLKVNLIGSTICCIIMLVMDFLLIPSIGYKGAAFANLISYSVATSYILIQSGHYMKVSFKDFLILKKSDFKVFSTRIIESGIKS